MNALHVLSVNQNMESTTRTLWSIGSGDEDAVLDKEECCPLCLGNIEHHAQ